MFHRTQDKCIQVERVFQERFRLFHSKCNIFLQGKTAFKQFPYRNDIKMCELIFNLTIVIWCHRQNSLKLMGCLSYLCRVASFLYFKSDATLKRYLFTMFICFAITDQKVAGKCQLLTYNIGSVKAQHRKDTTLCLHFSCTTKGIFNICFSSR